MSTALQDAIGRAQANAAALVPSDPAPVAVRGGGTPITMEDLASVGISVDKYLKVKDDGLFVGLDKKLKFDEMIVEIDMTEVVPNQTIKFGNPAKYAKTVDGIVVAGTAKSWAQEIAEAQRVDAKARPYPSAEIPMTVVDSVIVNGQAVLKEGERVGHALSTTNWNNWKRFWQGLVKEGRQSDVVMVKVGYQERTGNGNTWGILTFELAD